MPIEDHYAVLGITRTAGAAEIRRAYRLLALRHHPDRAGPDGTARFQRISEAYRVLSSSGERATYDAIHDAGRPPPRHHGTGGNGDSSAAGSPATSAPAHPTEALIPRLCGHIDLLQARGVARVDLGGHIEVRITRDEARAGGVAAIHLPLTVPCPTCGGIAGPDGVWCRRCQYAGTVVEEVTLCVPIPEHAPDRLTFNVELERLGDLPPLTVRVRVA